MDAERRDNVATTAAIGLLAYTSADIAHHALGHGGACLALGGTVISLSSVFVSCSLHGAAIDLAGPMMNLVLGILAVLAARFATRASFSTARLFWILAAGFNLLWFAAQLVFSAATRADDWAWAMQRFQIGDPIRFSMIALGAFVYLGTMRVIASELAPYARPHARARRIVLIVWLTAGVTSCAMAALDSNAVAAILRHALPQSVAVSIGLLFVPRRAAQWQPSGETAPLVAFSVPWTAAAALLGVASALLLGPGIEITI